MIRFPRRSRPPVGVRFCDGCTEVSTAAQRAQRHLDRVRDQMFAATWPR